MVFFLNTMHPQNFTTAYEQNCSNQPSLKNYYKKSLVEPIRSYGIKLRWSAKTSNLNKIQTLQPKTPRRILTAHSRHIY